MSRGLSEAEASTMIVNGFIEPLVKELPMEYAVEMNRLIELQMEGSVGVGSHARCQREATLTHEHRNRSNDRTTDRRAYTRSTARRRSSRGEL